MKMNPCMKCGGVGKLNVFEKARFGRGSGWTTQQCDHCNGAGVVEVKR